MTRLGMVIDLHKCIGCHTCANACKMENNVPMGMLWNRVSTVGAEDIDASVGEYPHVTLGYTPISCQHCGNAPCVRVCPVQATYRDDQGRVLVDYEKCIGCRMCMAACPYNVRCFNWSDPVYDPGHFYGDKDVTPRWRGVVEKCTFCKERIDRAEEPMCVMCCPAEARIFGDLDDLDSEVAQLARKETAHVLLPEMATEPHVIYIH